MQQKNNLTPNYFSYAIYSVIVTALLFILFGSNGWGPAAENEQAIGQISRWCERVRVLLLYTEGKKRLKEYLKKKGLMLYKAYQFQRIKRKNG